MDRRANKKKLSKHLLEMKFMKRTKEKKEIQVNKDFFCICIHIMAQSLLCGWYFLHCRGTTECPLLSVECQINFRAVTSNINTCSGLNMTDFVIFIFFNNREGPVPEINIIWPNLAQSGA